MNKKLFLVLFLAGFSLPSNAQRFDITADIGQIRYHEASNTLAAPWKKYVWFTLVGISEVPNCKKVSGEYAIVIPEGNNNAIAMLLSAKMANKQVVVTIDDSITFRGYCKLQYFTIK